MNPRTVTAGIGGLTVLLGIGALLQPELVMKHVLGLAVDPGATANFARGEIRAAYGGIFTVVGVFTVLAAMSPYANRGRLLFVGLIWIGACAGRLFGVIADGSPGLFGWLSAGFELALGGALVAVSQMAEPPDTGYVSPAMSTAPAGDTPADASAA
jgi:hypothetical protein